MTVATLSRRSAISMMAGSPLAWRADAASPLTGFLAPAQGLVILLDFHSGAVIRTNHPSLYYTAAGAPGSVLKPFVLASLLRTGRLRRETSFLCPRQLRIEGRTFDCTHPMLSAPLHIDSALAYSCNCFVAHFTSRFQPGELANALQSFGLHAGQDAARMLALGAGRTRATVLDVARAYRTLARQTALPEMAPILEGLEGAVSYGTGRAAQVRSNSVAGKTGSAGDGASRTAWFAGFMPARSPSVVVAVMLAGHSGGSDAAPIAGEILTAWSKGQL